MPVRNSDMNFTSNFYSSQVYYELCATETELTSWNFLFRVLRGWGSVLACDYTAPNIHAIMIRDSTAV